MFNAAGNPSLLFEHQPGGLAPVGGSRVRRLPYLLTGWLGKFPSAQVARELAFATQVPGVE
jgi:hypothetical protein